MLQLNQNSVALEELKTKAASLPAAIMIDSTLTQSGQAADAKVVGDKFAHHTQAASTITAGTFAGAVRAGTGTQEPTTAVLRNSAFVVPNSIGEPTISNGEILWYLE